MGLGQGGAGKLGVLRVLHNAAFCASRSKRRIKGRMLPIQERKVLVVGKRQH